MNATSVLTGVAASVGTWVTVVAGVGARRRGVAHARRAATARREVDSWAALAEGLSRWLETLGEPRARLPVGAASLVAAVALGSVLPLAAGVGVIAVPAWRAAARRRRAARAVEVEVAALATSISRSLGVGLSLRQALRRSLEGRDALTALAARLDAGESTPEAMASLLVTEHGDDVASFAALLDVGEYVGGRLAGSFDALAGAIADRREVDAEIRALTSQARASMVMLAALPFVSAALVGLIEPGVWAFLFGSAAGAACLAVAVGLDAAALAWMTALIRGVR